MLRALFIAVCLVGLSGSGRAAPSDPASLLALEAEVLRADHTMAPLLERRTRLEDEAKKLAAAIDSLKRSPSGVRRDLELQSALAASQAKTDELDRVQSELRWREPGLKELRRRLVRVIDELLQAGGQSEAQRLSLDRLHTATVALLVSPALPLRIVRDDGKESRVADPLDGPRELRAKADLLRDSGDKLRRESQRIATHLDGIERRRHLRERAGALDEDLFGESTSNRVAGRAQNTVAANTKTATAGGATTTQGQGVPNPAFDSPTQPAPGTPTGVGTPPAPAIATARTSETTVLRNLVDPATLDELRAADAIDDTDRQTRALKKAQAELDSLAKELERRAKVLDGRAEEIKKQK